MPSKPTKQHAKPVVKTIMSLDPGKTAGYAIWRVHVDVTKTLTSKDVLKSGTINEHPEDKSKVFESLYHTVITLMQLVDEYNPSVLVVENVMSSPMKSKVARIYLSGVYLWAALYSTMKGLEFTEIAPTSLKKRLTGSGKASKVDVIKEVNEQLGMELKNKDNNEADALALGLVYLKETY